MGEKMKNRVSNVEKEYKIFLSEMHKAIEANAFVLSHMKALEKELKTYKPTPGEGYIDHDRKLGKLLNRKGTTFRSKFWVLNEFMYNLRNFEGYPRPSLLD